MKQNLSNVVVGLVLLFFVSAKAQEQQVSSLLSNIGLGTTFSEATIAEKAQGDLSVVGNNNVEVLSFTNPALLSDLQLTSFGVAFQVQSNNVTAQESNFSTSNTTISNLSFGVPLGVKGGLSLGLRVHSAVGFEVNTDNFYNQGSGSVNQIYAGIGYEIFKNFSLGLQANMYFGETTKTQAFKNVQKSTVYDETYNVKGLATKVGAQYKLNLSEKLIAQVGAYGVLNHQLTATGNARFYEAIQTDENSFSMIATPITSNLSGTQENPFKSVLGLGLGTYNHWFAGVSYESQGATTYSGNVFNQTNNTDVPVDFESKSKISVGGYIIPKKYALKNYLNRVTYRAGFKYENTGTVLNNESLKNIGMSFGVGLPIGKRISYANFTLEVGQLGEFSKNNYQEEYINVGVNFSLSDKWFEKRVIR
ncbi:hypothetical protein AXE80_02565 [Wenyingzhuangia fucanilytica]|uniref:Aromatic hydrocarbon degradation protein n=1 Tax=Wenyingzhuangia fucanilytica TaxID=1790137 RepID=A0A1B1Y393_9FLAO|nr:hypothetical protein [Wenyingzhuangia fucanilytica]ANW95233.1 hypothetical protein AXE80_02565 [Wenyingzhuangia fucanilytica]